jgi:hypothetical protein
VQRRRHQDTGAVDGIGGDRRFGRGKTLRHLPALGQRRRRRPVGVDHGADRDPVEAGQGFGVHRGNEAGADQTDPAAGGRSGTAIGGRVGSGIDETVDRFDTIRQRRPALAANRLIE